MKKIYFLLLALCLFTKANSQIINFPDPIFKERLVNSTALNYRATDLSGNYFAIDSNGDGEIQISEASQVKSIELSYYNGDGLGITSLVGINEFPNLVSFGCSDASLSSLDIHGLQHLENLFTENSGLNTVTVYDLPQLKYLQLEHNNLSDLSLNNFPNLKWIYCGYNSLTNLDLSMLTGLERILCNNNQLVSINMKNGISQTIVSGTVINGFYENPTLRYVCVDDSELTYVQNKISALPYGALVSVNSYCDFVPGGQYYTIQGNNKFDENNNGCDVLDFALNNLKFNITNGSNSGNLIANTSGNYNIPVQTGTYTITPVFENPAYFTASPSSVNVTFPVQANPFNQDFCVIATGVNPDLEVTSFAATPALPGTHVMYILSYKNKGNTTQSGTVNLVFNDAVLDFVDSTPATSSQTVNNLSWNFTNLRPFEKRRILLSFITNSPSDTPPLNSGDVLNYTATITSAATDDLPNDNTFVFNQVVVNSFDPNDKTCLEGATITPDKVGDYVHYMIRFENNGTANAHNIMVKDMIDANKFDVNSLIAIDGSHEFFTRINGNKVEFIFENINLPFDDANNGGYVAFKIKTKPTLINGDTFSNTASIYFDYNLPIVTNTATTTIAALNRQDFEFANYFKLYPNPVHDVLNINSKEDIEISSISIYNTLGQLVLVVPNAQNTKTVNVSNMPSGNYFIKINSSKGSSNTKFIKQ
ncbi:MULTISPECIES: DUF7619 domain-containing protein [Flavobacterium]|uniref:T9SS type A sorting domain-containing protein n=1 Tax=Flavobacterium hankyongi TaxID=1176532 RepID=A0ABP8ZJE8_9FLAO|nr:T9SS type A sorting domain-containing protein [Flavobacterium sp. N1846]